MREFNYEIDRKDAKKAIYATGEKRRNTMTNFTVNEIEETINKLLPNREKRRICLSLFLEALKKANSYGSNKWGAY